MTPLKKLAIVAAVQLVFLFGIVGFKQYTLWTSTIVVLSVESIDPAGADNVTVRYVISEIDLDEDAYRGDWDVFVELQEGANGVWDAVAVHDNHERSFDDTVLMKGRLLGIDHRVTPAGAMPVTYDLEELHVSGASGRDIPWERGVLVEIKVDRFGNATPRHLLTGGETFDLKRR